MQISGSSVIVTGGASGLGAATAAWLAERGARVAIFDIDEDKGTHVAAKCGALFVKASVYDEEDVEAGFEQVVNTHGLANILVNCAGVAPDVRLIRPEHIPYPMEMLVRTLEVNLMGTILMAAHFARYQAYRECPDEELGVIINTASVAAYDGQIGHVAYAASKAGVVGATLPMARDLAIHRIRVMTIAPGLFNTPMLDGIPGADRTELFTQVPHPARAGHPNEFAMMVECIVTNPMLNGEVIRLDGALRLAPV